MLLLSATGVVGYWWTKPGVSFGTSGIAINVPMTQGGVLCGNNTSTLLLATSTSGRNFATISNDSSISVFIGFGNKATSNNGLLLNASSTFTLDATHSFAGAIYCTGLGATASTSYSDSNS